MPKKKAPRKPPSAAMLELIIGYWVSQLVHVAAKLGLADLLAKGPRSPAELARAARVQEAALRRLLRALASVGVFAECRDGRFELTPLGATLRSDAPDSMHAFALMMVEEYNWKAWAKLLDGVKTGGLPFDQAHGMPVFQFLAQRPELARVFAQSMASLSATENPAVAAAYDFSKLGTLVDVGGSHGRLLATVLKQNPRLRGVLFDEPHVIARARQDKQHYVTAGGVAKRCELVGGDFFRAVPAGADAYLLKYIMHDWDDARAAKILANCRRAMAPGGRVLVVDTVVPPGNAPHWGKLLDINMLVLTGGRERTKEEFRALFAKAELKLKRVIPTTCPLSIVEGVAG